MLTTPPAIDELEVTVFGTGFGESVVAHLGYGDWLIVDSCCKRGSNDSVPLEYLESLKVDVAVAVKRIVATHWHNDHIKGLAQVVRACKAAKFVCSQALLREEFFTLLELWKTRPVGSPFKEFDGVIRELTKSGRLTKDAQGDVGFRWAVANRILWQRTAASASGDQQPGKVVSLSPSDLAIKKALRSFADFCQSGQSTHLKVPTPLAKNPLSVVLWIEVGSVRCLLGADMEEKDNPHGGWKVIVDSAERPDGQSSYFKIPHHGSSNGDYAPLWSMLLEAQPVAVTTTFRSGKVNLPTREDIRRICNHTQSAYVTTGISSHSSRIRCGSVGRTILDTVRSIRYVDGFFGVVRARRGILASHAVDWRIETFGDGGRLDSISTA